MEIIIYKKGRKIIDGEIEDAVNLANQLKAEIEDKNLVEDAESIKPFKGEEDDMKRFVYASTLLKELGYNLHRVVSGFDDITEELEWAEEVPYSEKDNDQYLYQKGFADSQISSIKIYESGEHIATYGSQICGEQSVYCYEEEDEEGETKLVPVDEGEETRLWDDPTTMLEAMRAQKETDEDYLYYGMNCWLKGYFEDAEGNDLTVKSDQLAADAEEYIHSSIYENIDIEPGTMREILKHI